MSGLRVYRELLTNRPLMRLLLGEFISGIGDWLYIVAIFVVIYRESGDASLVGAFGAVRLLPYVVLSVPAGFVADRFDRRLVLLVSDLYRGALMVVMAVLVATGGPTLLIAALAILAASGSAFFYPAMGAYLPALARDERQLGPANSAWANIQNVSYILGPAIAGIVLAVGSVLAAFVLNAVSFLFIAAILWTLPSSRAGHALGAGSGHASSAGDAPLTPTGDPSTATGVVATTPGAQPEQAPASPPLKLRPIAGLTLVQLIGGFLGGGLQVITVIIAIDVLHAGEEANGYLNAAIGIGGLLGGIGAGALVLRRHLGMPLLIGTIVTGIGTIALGAATNLPFALVAIGVLSAGALIVDVISTTVFQQLVPDALRGRAIGILMAVSTLTGAAGAFLLPVFLATFGPFESLAVTGVVTIAITLIGLAMLGSAADLAPTPYEATIARVMTNPLFAGVPRARLDTAMRHVTEVPIKAGEPAVSQGDPADRFYIIESGTFQVTQAAPSSGEAVTLRALGPDEVFGELGLLNRTPRTATVTAETDGLLLALERDDFLALVGAAGPLRGRLLGLYGGRSATR